MWILAGPFNLITNATTWIDWFVAMVLIAILLSPVIWAFWRPTAISILSALLAAWLWIIAGWFFGRYFAI